MCGESGCLTGLFFQRKDVTGAVGHDRGCKAIVMYETRARHVVQNLLERVPSVQSVRVYHDTIRYCTSGPRKLYRRAAVPTHVRSEVDMLEHIGTCTQHNNNKILH